MSVIEAESDAVEADDDSEPDWLDELALATERLMVVAETLKDDRLLTQGARRLMADMDGTSRDLCSRLYEAVAGVLVLEAAEQQRKARPGRR